MVVPAEALPKIEFIAYMELEQRLGLYQVFLKLYEHHHGLLDEILKLENTGNKFVNGLAPRYIQGVVQDRQVYLVTNLVDAKTQMLFQPQGVWTLGRSRQAAMPIADRRLSRQHAVIQYIEDEGFYLVDLNSTNGTFVNGEPVYQRILLKDGDRIRLGSLAFSFFFGSNTVMLGNVPPYLIAELNAISNAQASDTPEDAEAPTSSIKSRDKQTNQPRDTSIFLKSSDINDELIASAIEPQFSPTQQSEILDRFFSRRSSDAGTQK